MHPIRKKLGKIPLFKILSSLKITVICLGLLYLLTFWGTIDQMNNGLYLAQEKFFNSIFFMLFDFIPFPGARSILWVLFVNLICVATTRLVYRWSNIGITIIHLGLILFLVSAFLTFHGIEETNITLRENEGTNVSKSYHQWELSVWEDRSGDTKSVLAHDTAHIHPGDIFNFDQYGFKVKTKIYHQNSEAYVTDQGDTGIVNDSGIRSIVPVDISIEPEENYPAGIFEIQDNSKNRELLLYGGEIQPTRVEINQKVYAFQLRRRRSPIPFILKLIDFKKELHPNTEVAKSYQSLVEVITPDSTREVLISMNEPLRYKSFTFYQASYAIDEFGRELSTLAVVHNPSRVMPYVASLATFAGLLIHMLLMGFRPRKKI